MKNKYVMDRLDFCIKVPHHCFVSLRPINTEDKDSFEFLNLNGFIAPVLKKYIHCKMDFGSLAI